MTKIIATHICNINETFIGIFVGIPLEYIVYYHHGYYKHVLKREQYIPR